jgi:molecular chaperone DnaK
VPEVDELMHKINNAKRIARNVNASDISTQLNNIENQLENEKGSSDGRLRILNEWRKVLLQLEALEKVQEWPAIEQGLKNAYFELEDLIGNINRNEHIDKLNTSKIDNLLHEIKQKVEAIIRDKNRKEAKELKAEIHSLDYNLRNELTGGSQDVQLLRSLNEDFEKFHWKDTTKARQLINKGLQMVASGNNSIRPVLVELVQLIPRDEIPTGTLE